MAQATFQWNKTLPQMKNDLGLNERLCLFVANDFYRRMDRFVPMDEGALSQTVSISADKDAGYIDYLVPYAHYQYTGTNFNFSTEHHPLATSYWDKACWASDRNQIVKAANIYRERISE